MKKRIIGIDIARALAVFGMIIVNFKIVFGQSGNEFLKFFAGIFEGKAAAIFVVLAGVGIALMSNSAIVNNDRQKLKRIRTRIIKRSIFLFIGGLSYIVIWPADILHFYGIYMLITLIVLQCNKKTIMGIALGLIFVYPILVSFFNYESGWNFDTLNYYDFWTVTGFIRNLLYNGFHPVIPWAAFMLIGLWYGRQDLNDEKYLKKSMMLSGIVYLATRMISMILIFILSEGNETASVELFQVLGTNPMPPLPIYMITGSSLAIFTISACIMIGKRFSQSKILISLYKTGQLALTFYVAHVIIGMGLVEAVNPEKMGNYSITFSFTYALIFSAFCIVFAIIWTRFSKIGPVEWVMRKISD